MNHASPDLGIHFCQQDLVCAEVAGRRVHPVSFWRNDRPDPVAQEFFTQEVTVVALVGKEQPRLANRHRQQMFAKLKTLVRKADERTVETTWRRIGELLKAVSPQECSNYIGHAGYGSI